MKKSERDSENDELRPEYTREVLGVGVRGKRLEAYRKGTNIALIAPDLRAAFPDDDAVNEALRTVLREHKRSP